MPLPYASNNRYTMLNMNDRYKLDLLCLQALAYVFKRNFTEPLMIEQAVKFEFGLFGYLYLSWFVMSLSWTGDTVD